MLSASSFARFLDPRYVPIEDEEFDERIANMIGNQIGPRHLRGNMRGDWEGFFWCTDFAATSADLASQRLGLEVPKGLYLIRMDLPRALPQGGTVHAPTVFEAPAYRLFIPCQEADGWGRTLDFRNQDWGEREVVVRTIPVDHTWGLLSLGKASFDSAADVIDDDALLDLVDRLLHGGCSD